MSDIKIFVEGGGDSIHQRRLLRQGFDALLANQKQNARQKRVHWDLICEGGREAAHDALINEVARNPQCICVLLVDAEGPLPAGAIGVNVARRDFLMRRDQHWRIGDIAADRIHLMVQSMEAWIVADPETLAAYYGQRFNRGALPARNNLEEEPKDAVLAGLRGASRQTQKGEYAKLRHASDLLGKIDPARVAVRCPHFGLFVRAVEEIIAGL